MTSPLPEFVEHVAGVKPGGSVYDLLLDHTKISWYRVIVVVNREYQHDRQTDDPGEQES